MVAAGATGAGKQSLRPLLEGVFRKACNYCVKSKRGCNGGKPCSQCIRRKQDCTYSQRRKSGPRGRPSPPGAKEAAPAYNKKCHSEDEKSTSSKKSTQKPGAKRGRKPKKQAVSLAEPAAAEAPEQEQEKEQETRDGSPAPSDTSMPSPARTASLTSVCSSETSSLSASSSQSASSSSAGSWDSDASEQNEHPIAEAVRVATARRNGDGDRDGPEDMAVQNTVPPEIKSVKTAATAAAAAEAATVNLQRHQQHRQALVSASVSRSDSPSLTDMLLEPPTPPRRQRFGGADGRDDEVNDVLESSGETEGMRLSQGGKTRGLQRQITYISGTTTSAVAGTEGGDVSHLAQPRAGGQSVAGATTAAPLHQITSQPWEVSDIAGYARRMPIPVVADNSTSRGHWLRQQQRGGAGASVLGLVTASGPSVAAVAPAPSSFGGALLPQQSVDLKESGGMGMDLDECPAMMREMVPSLTREMSLVRAVEALGNEQQNNGGGMGHSESVVLSPWYD